MGVGVAVFWGSVVVCASVVLVVLGALRINARRKPRDLSDTLAERIDEAAKLLQADRDLWLRLDRQCVTGDAWPGHDEDDEDCWCLSCYGVEIDLMQTAEVNNLFAGLVDTPELRELADRARRWVR